MDLELDALEVAQGRIAVLELQLATTTDELSKQVAATRKLSQALDESTSREHSAQADLATAHRELEALGGRATEE